MRLSQETPVPVQSPVKEGDTNRAFFDAAAIRLEKEALTCAILLVGGADARSIAVRRAQAPLRFDRRMSDFSHAAILTHPQAGVASRGVEVNLLAPRPMAQMPVCNGVTEFTLADYVDRDAFPNLALLTFTDATPDSRSGEGEQSGLPTAAEIKTQMHKALAEPNSDRIRYPLWDQLAPWAAYSYAPDTADNPLLHGTPHPAAALCELAFSAAGIDITPGATDNHACPEHLWATFKHWGQRLVDAAGLSLSVLAVIRDKAGTMPVVVPNRAPRLSDHR